MPAPLKPTMATTCPAFTRNETFPQNRLTRRIVMQKLTSRNSTDRERRGNGIALGFSITSVCVSSIPKMRSDAASAC